jgi:uncharacterized protein
MRWIDPGEPLLAATDVGPPSGAAQWDRVQWHHIPAGELGISSRTGGWALLSPDERAAVDGGVADRVLLEALWRRNLIRVGAASPFDPDTKADAIASSRDYYTLVLLLNSGCNLVCSYCYLGHSTPSPAKSLSLDTARAAILEALNKPWPRLLIDFGEIAVAEEALRILLPWAVSVARSAGKDVLSAVQTNGTTITDSLAAFLSEFEVQVGISIDGPQDVHDAARTFRSGAGSYERAAAGADLCKSVGLKTHLITTVTSRNVDHPERVLGELERHSPDSYLLKPVIAQGEAEHAWDREGISAAQFATFMRYTIESADTHGTRRLDQSAHKFLLRTLGDRGGWRDSCTSRSCGSGKSLHVVGADGTVHACPRFVTEAPVRTKQLLTIGAGPSKPELLTDLLAPSLRHAPDTCTECSWLGSCGGGCTLAGQGADRSIPLPDPHCDSYYETHTALFDTVISSFLLGRHHADPAFNGAVLREVCR